MAIRSSCHGHGLPSTTAVPRFSTSKRKVTTLRLSAAAHSSHERHLSSSARSIKTVFEDQVRGVVCYRDGSGEVVCEGFDEGPRLGMRLPARRRPASHGSDWPMGIRVTDFIELSTLRVLEDEDALK